MNRIGIAIPAREDVKTKFASDLLVTTCTHLNAFPSDLVIPMFHEGTILVSQRTELVLEARRNDCTHILFLDSDMRFPPDIIARMLAAEELVVAANCARRRMPTGPTAANYADNLSKTPVYTFPESTGLEQVNSVGTAVMLIDMKVFDIVPVPWFATPWVVDQHGFMGEDVYFCLQLKKHGVPIMIDHDLSKLIKHIGAWEFSHDHVMAVRQLDSGKAAEEALVVLAETWQQKMARELSDQARDGGRQQQAYDRQAKGMGYQ